MKPENIKSVTGRKLYELIMEGKLAREQEWRKSSRASSVASPILDSSTPKIDEPEQSIEEFVEKEVIIPEIISPPTQTNYLFSQQPNLHDLLSVYKQLGVVGEQENLLKMTLDTITNTSFFLTGKSSAGKSHLMNTLLKVLPDNIVYKLSDTKKDSLFKHSGLFKDKILVIPEIQTYFRGSGNEKDALRCIANHEPYPYMNEKGDKIIVEARMVMTSGADQNKYKKTYLDNDVELMRRFHEINVELTDDKVRDIIAAKNKQYTNNVFNQINPVLTDESSIKDHINYCLDAQKSNQCNPFVGFISEYTISAVNENQNLTAVSKTDSQFKHHMDALTLWNSLDRNYEHQNITGKITSLEDVFVAKKLIDHEMGIENKNFNWTACWESGLESMRQSQFPQEVISDYQRRHLINNQIVVKDPFSGTDKILVDYNIQNDQKQDVHVTDLAPVFSVNGGEYKKCEIITKLPPARDIKRIGYNNGT